MFFQQCLQKGDIVMGVVSTVQDSGLLITLFCLDGGKARDIDELNITVSDAECFNLPAWPHPRLDIYQSKSQSQGRAARSVRTYYCMSCNIFVRFILFILVHVCNMLFCVMNIEYISYLLDVAPGRRHHCPMLKCRYTKKTL